MVVLESFFQALCFLLQLSHPYLSTGYKLEVGIRGTSLCAGIWVFGYLGICSVTGPAVASSCLRGFFKKSPLMSPSRGPTLVLINPLMERFSRECLGLWYTSFSSAAGHKQSVRQEGKRWRTKLKCFSNFFVEKSTSTLNSLWRVIKMVE